MNDFFTLQRLNFLFLTETWNNVGDLSPFTELVPPDCDSFSSPRTTGCGEVLALFFKNTFVQIEIQFTGFLGGIVMKYDRFVILGDFNIHICCSSNGLARELYIF